MKIKVRELSKINLPSDGGKLLRLNRMQKGRRKRNSSIKPTKRLWVSYYHQTKGLDVSQCPNLQEQEILLKL